MKTVIQNLYLVFTFFFIAACLVFTLYASWSGEAKEEPEYIMENISIATEPESETITIASSLAMDIIVKQEGQWRKFSRTSVAQYSQWKELAKTPGVVQVPRHKEYGIRLTALQSDNIDLYVEILNMYNISHLEIASALSGSQMQECREAGLFDNLKELVFSPVTRFGQATICFDALSGLDKLEALEIRESKMTDLAFLKGMKSLESLKLGECRNITDATAIGDLKGLRILEMSSSPSGSSKEIIGVQDFNFLCSLKQIHSLRLDFQYELRNLDTIAHLHDLRELSLRGIVFERQVSLEAMKNFRNLEIVALPITMTDEQMKQLRDDGVFNKAVSIDLSLCELLTTTQSLAGLNKLERLCLDGCLGLKDLVCLESLPNLRELCLMQVNLKNTNSFAELQRLEQLTFSWNENLVDISTLSKLNNLKHLTFEEMCNSLEDVSPLRTLVKIRNIDLTGCGGIKAQDVISLQKQMPWCYIQPEHINGLPVRGPEEYDSLPEGDEEFRPGAYPSPAEEENCKQYY